MLNEPKDPIKSMIDNLKEIYEAEKLNKVEKNEFLKNVYFLQSYFKIFVLKKRRRLQVTKQHDQLELYIYRQTQSNQKHPILKIIIAYLKSI